MKNNTHKEKTSQSKRKILAYVGVTTVLSQGWVKPVVNSVLLPAHAESTTAKPLTPPTPTGLSATNTQMQVDDTVNTYYTTFQYDDNGSFSSPVYIYDNFLSTIHNAAWLAPAGSTWYRARFNTAPNGGGTHGSWTPDNIHGNF